MEFNQAKWEVVLASPTGIVVSWQEKYGNNMREECIGLWYAKDIQQYMLTWKDSKKILLEKNNINDLKFSKKEDVTEVKLKDE